MIGPEGYRQSTDKQALILAEMTWPEFRSAAPNLEIALIPTGSTEQHGPGGTFAVDTARADGLARLVAARLYPRVVCAPAVSYGVSHHHMSFPGTMTLEPDTFTAICDQIMESFYAHGIKKMVFINGHGGNVPAQTVAANRFRFRHHDTRVATVAITKLVLDIRDSGTDSPLTGHACEAELSQCLYMAPWTVRESALAAGEIHHGAQASNPAFTEARPFESLTANGALGDATRSTVEFGRAMIDTATDRLAQILSEWL